jgi:hypothetical protein
LPKRLLDLLADSTDALHSIDVAKGYAGELSKCPLSRVHSISHHAAAAGLIAILAAVGLRLAFKLFRLVLPVAVAGGVYLLHPH